MPACAVRGFYCRSAPSVRTRRLLREDGRVLYDSDSYADELPYYVAANPDDATGPTTKRHHLVVPYSLVTNDSKFAPGRAFRR